MHYSKYILRGLALLVFVLALFYTLIYIEGRPYWGVTFSRLQEGWLITLVDSCDTSEAWCEYNQQKLFVGDLLVKVNEEWLGRYQRLPMIEPGQQVTLEVMRNGERVVTNWMGPKLTLTTHLTRAVSFLFVLPFLLAAWCVVFLLPKQHGQWLLSSTFLGYGLWLAAGPVAHVRLYGAAEVMHFMTWFLVGIVIHLHWDLPSPIFRIPTRFVAGWYALFVLISLAATIWWHIHFLYLALFLEVVVSVSLLVWRWARGLDRRAVRLMLTGLGLAFAPGILWAALVATNTSVSVAFTAVVLLAFLLWPAFYIFAVYQYQLGQAEGTWRKNLLRIVLLDVYVNCLTLLFAWTGSIWGWSTSIIGLHILIALAVVWGGVAIFGRLTSFFDTLLGGETEKAVEDCISKLSSKITSISGIDELRQMLQVMGSQIAIEQMAFYLEHQGEVVDIISCTPKPEISPPWGVLALPLRIKDRQVGLWLLGSIGREGMYTAKCRSNLETLADQLAAVVEIIRQREMVQQQAEAMLSQERMAALGRMGAEIAHQFNGPLFVIRSAIAAHCDNNKDGLPRWLEMAYKETEELGQKVAFMTKFVQPIRDEQMAMVDVNGAVHQALSWAQEIIKANRVSLLTDLSNELPDVLVWPSDLPDAIFNLIQNACEAMPNGGKLEVRTAVEGAWATIRVCDTGCGVKESDIKHLFDPFYTRKENGTGFGLPIAYAIIERARGTITVESEVGSGSCFVIRLPLKRLDRPLEGVQWQGF